jgi:hypothetical protein
MTIFEKGDLVPRLLTAFFLQGMAILYVLAWPGYRQQWKDLQYLGPLVLCGIVAFSFSSPGVKIAALSCFVFLGNRIIWLPLQRSAKDIRATVFQKLKANA